MESKRSPIDIAQLLSQLDVTQVFKTKGNLRRWSAKRTIGGVVALTACNEAMVQGISAYTCVFAFIGILPLCLSFLEKE
jgi:hypothetical protein